MRPCQSCLIRWARVRAKTWLRKRDQLRYSNYPQLCQMIGVLTAADALLHVSGEYTDEDKKIVREEAERWALQSEDIVVRTPSIASVLQQIAQTLDSIDTQITEINQSGVIVHKPRTDE